jgi:hypothetical protein
MNTRSALQHSENFSDFDIALSAFTYHQTPPLVTRAEQAANFLRRFYLPVLRRGESYSLGRKIVSAPEMLAEAERRGFK